GMSASGDIVVANQRDACAQAGGARSQPDQESVLAAAERATAGGAGLMGRFQGRRGVRAGDSTRATAANPRRRPTGLRAGAENRSEKCARLSRAGSPGYG